MEKASILPLGGVAVGSSERQESDSGSWRGSEASSETEEGDREWLASSKALGRLILQGGEARHG